MQIKYIKYAVLFVVMIFLVGCIPKETPKAPETSATPATTPAVEPTTTPTETPAQEPAKTAEGADIAGQVGKALIKKAPPTKTPIKTISKPIVITNFTLIPKKSNNTNNTNTTPTTNTSASCTNDCTTNTCFTNSSGNFAKTCSNYDSDPCLDLREAYCNYGCANGACQTAPVNQSGQNNSTNSSR